MEDTLPSAARDGMGKEEKEEWKGSSVSHAIEVQVTGESLVMDFDSDSDDDDFVPRRHAGGRGTRSGGSVQPSDPCAGRHTGLEQGDIFLDIDDDFYIVDTPTSTKVVRVLCAMFAQCEMATCVYNSLILIMQAPGSKPIVKCLLEEGEAVEVVDDHFSIPVCSALHHVQVAPTASCMYCYVCSIPTCVQLECIPHCTHLCSYGNKGRSTSRVKHGSPIAIAC